MLYIANLYHFSMVHSTTGSNNNIMVQMFCVFSLADAQQLDEAIQRDLLLGFRPKSVPATSQTRFLWPNRVRLDSNRITCVTIEYVHVLYMCMSTA